MKQVKATMDALCMSFPNICAIAMAVMTAGTSLGTLTGTFAMVKMVNENLEKCLESFEPILCRLQKAGSECWLFIEQQYAQFLEDNDPPAAKAQKAKVLQEAKDEANKTAKLQKTAEARLEIAATAFKEAVEPEDVRRTTATLKAANTTVAKWTSQAAVALKKADALEAAEAVRAANALQAAEAREEMAQANGLAALKRAEVRQVSKDDGRSRSGEAALEAAEARQKIQASAKKTTQAAGKKNALWASEGAAEQVIAAAEAATAMEAAKVEALRAEKKDDADEFKEEGV